MLKIANKEDNCLEIDEDLMEEDIVKNYNELVKFWKKYKHYDFA